MSTKRQQENLPITREEFDRRMGVLRRGFIISAAFVLIAFGVVIGQNNRLRDDVNNVQSCAYVDNTLAYAWNHQKSFGGDR